MAEPSDITGVDAVITAAHNALPPLRLDMALVARCEYIRTKMEELTAELERLDARTETLENDIDRLGGIGRLKALTEPQRGALAMLFDELPPHLPRTILPGRD